MGRLRLDFLDILDRIDESVTVYDKEGRFVFMNGAAVRPFGRPMEELIGKRPGTSSHRVRARRFVTPSKRSSPAARSAR